MSGNRGGQRPPLSASPWKGEVARRAGEVDPLPVPGCRREGLSGPGPTAGLLSCAGKKVTKEARLGGLRRPPKNPREPPFETCSRSMPSS